MRRPLTIALLILLATAAGSAAQQAPKGGMQLRGNLHDLPLSDLVLNYEKIAGKVVRIRAAQVGTIHFMVPTEGWQVDAPHLRALIDGALLRQDLVMYLKPNGDYEITAIDDAVPRELTIAELKTAPDDAWVSVGFVPERGTIRPIKLATRAIRVDYPAQGCKITGLARDVRRWKTELAGLAEIEAGDRRLYADLPLNALEIRLMVETLFPGQAVIEAAEKGLTITGSPALHGQLETLFKQLK